MTSRAEVEDFLYHEAALLDEWRLDEWLALLTDDAGDPAVVGGYSSSRRG